MGYVMQSMTAISLQRNRLMGHYGNVICSLIANGYNSMALETTQNKPVSNQPIVNGKQSETDKMKARIAELEAKLAVANKPKALTMKVSEKGAGSLYGLGRFPVTLYYGQWTRIVDNIGDIKAWLEANKSSLAMKE